jgi:hypothetical protein
VKPHLRHWLIHLLAGLLLAGLMVLFDAIDPAHAAVPAMREQPDLVLHGTLDGKDNQTYRMLPFDVPAGTRRITVQFDYNGHEDEHTRIDLGLLGPDGFQGKDGFRGWSGGSKLLFTVSATDATPAYLPGPIDPGRWTLLLGTPSIRKHSRAHYTAKLWFGRPNDPAWVPAVLNPPLRREAGWYRGDLHMHTAHSDGSCDSQSGREVPCPLFLTVQDAVNRGLDFIAITDHNTVSQVNAMRELQPYFDRLLLIPGRELTTFQGHANLFGTTAPVDFRVDGQQDWNALLRQVEPLHGLISINHPIRPDDETCMGCGWVPKGVVDLHKVQAIEAVNGIDAVLPDSGIPFWQSLLDRGYRLTAVGGSDNHDARRALALPDASVVGTPTTVVHASDLSMQAILTAIRAGHVFIDVQGSRDHQLDLTARSGSQTAEMGDALAVPAGGTVRFTVNVTAPAGGAIEIIEDGKIIHPGTDLALHLARQSVSFDWTSDGKRHWLRANVRGAARQPLLVGNPIYINAD